MRTPLHTFFHWLHGQWPAGTPEKLPVVGKNGTTSIPGVFIVGDLTGVPLLKFAADSGAQAAQQAKRFQDTHSGDTDVAIIGAGISGVACAIACRQAGLSFELLETNQLFSTIANFPVGKPIFTYPTDMTPAGDFQVQGDTRETLLADLHAQAQAHSITTRGFAATHIEQQKKSIHVHGKGLEPLRAKTVIIAIGRSGNYRRMGIPGEKHDKVSNRLHDPAKLAGKNVLVVGGGDSAVEAAIATAEADTENKGHVTLAYRGPELTRPKPDNIKRLMEHARAGTIDLQLATSPTRVDETSVTLQTKNGDTLHRDNDAVLALIGREAPLDFFRRSGLAIRGENSWGTRTWLLLFALVISFIYGMKAFGWLGDASWHPVTIAKEWIAQNSETDKGLLYTIIGSISNGFGFFIAFTYCLAVVGFGIDRIRRRKTPYVTRQSITLMIMQCLPLFILPEIVLPWFGHMGFFDSGLLASVADELFPAVGYDANGREYWRAYGFILAWPLFIWNLFSEGPLLGWLIISGIQTFVIIPFIVYRWGKGAYCGWICSCGALAETMGDRHREKMPHGKNWNKLNMVGQILLAFAFLMLLVRIISWATGNAAMTTLNEDLFMNVWKPVVDWFLAGALGTGLYFWFSGRVWCRFACPLAALMHIYARFSSYRILADSKKCISCNSCTSVCHQGIDIMNFANKNKHMSDPECVRCSTCIQVCPTGVLQFGRVDKYESPIDIGHLPTRRD